MNSDCALLLQTVLGERGCVDATLQDTTHTVPFVYRVVAEQSYYDIYTVSVVKALLHEKDAAFAQLARWQAQRTTTSSAAAASATTPTTSTAAAAVMDLPSIVPSDALDMFVTVIGGGTCCELLLRLLCGNFSTHNGAGLQVSHHSRNGNGGLPDSQGGLRGEFSQPYLVHPSHVSVVTRQPERLARYAQRGVHCLTRHHGRAAVQQSDVVLLACPPALFREVAHDLRAVSPARLAAGATDKTEWSAAMAESTAGQATGRIRNLADGAGRSGEEKSSDSVLQSNAVLVSCMAGVPARKVALAFQRTPELTLVTRLVPHDGVADEAGENVTSTAASTSPPDKRSGVGETDRETPASSAPPVSLQQVAFHYQDTLEAYKAARMEDMRGHISFLRPAVLEQQTLMRAAAATAVTNADAPWLTTQGALTERADASPLLRALVAPRLTDFTAGRQPATAPSLDAFLDLWRLLQSYVRATFAAALEKARARGHSQLTRHLTQSSGLISVVVPETAYTPSTPPREAGEVEAELLPALALLPATKTRVLWDAWWRVGLNGRLDGPANEARGRSPRSAALPSSLAKGPQHHHQQQQHQHSSEAFDSQRALSAKVMAVTGAWLSCVYASDTALVADLELQYQRVLERQLPRTY